MSSAVSKSGSSEGRQLAGLQGRTLETLRAIPAYPNDKRILTTAEVKDLVDNKGAYFLDVRYPGEFASGHLPNAINITMRTTRTEDLKKRLAELPRRPVIVPCYERRSCFFGEIIGLELTEAGHTFEGRYTLPWEYFPDPVPPPHVLAWQEAQKRTIWVKAVDALSGVVSSVSKSVGILAAIVLIALASRLIILPFSLKAERDQLLMRRHGDEYRRIRADHKDDPQRRARAIRAFYRKYGLKPARNLLALLFLPVLALSVSAVHQTAAGLNHSVLWFSDFADRDYLFILPLLFGVLVAVYVQVSLTRTFKQRLAVWCLAFPLFTAAAVLMSAAANVYIVASMGSPLCAAVDRPEAVAQPPERRLEASEIVDLAWAGSSPRLRQQGL